MNSGAPDPWCEMVSDLCQIEACGDGGRIKVKPRRLAKGYFLTRIASYSDARWLCGFLRACGYDAHDPVRHDRFDLPNAWRVYVSDLASVEVLNACVEVEVVE